MTQPRLSLVANYLGFQVCWAACVLGGDAWALPIVGVFLAAHIWVHGKAEWRLIALVTFVGIIMDGTLSSLGVITFNNRSPAFWAANGGVIPFWMIGLWAAFASTLRHSLRAVVHHRIGAPLLGFMGGPLSYLAGERLDALALTDIALPVLGVCWGVLMWVVHVMQTKARRVKESLC